LKITVQCFENSISLNIQHSMLNNPFSSNLRVYFPSTLKSIPSLSSKQTMIDNKD